MDQFELEEELGKGNYGVVRKVMHKPTKVAMAMKVSRFTTVSAVHVVSKLQFAILQIVSVRKSV
jgi:serine/threonine protein kinase